MSLAIGPAGLPEVTAEDVDDLTHISDDPLIDRMVGIILEAGTCQSHMQRKMDE